MLADKETSAVEAHIGTWLEEVARIVSGGIKPGSGVDLHVQGVDGVVQLYAIQSAPNTKNAGGRKSDIEALRRGGAARAEPAPAGGAEYRCSWRPGEDRGDAVELRHHRAELGRFLGACERHP